jgi:hypothetical protein
MKRNTRIALLLVPLVVTILLYGIFQFTDPISVGPGGVLGVFVLIYLGCLSIVFIILRFGLYWVRKLLSGRKNQISHVSVSGIGSRKAYYVASVLAFAPVTLLAMHAYSQLQLTDVVLVGVLMAIVTFYILRRR